LSARRTATGGRIDRARPVTFTFDGRRFAGLAGDTLASALLANGVCVFGRSFKYHRPRGLLAAGSEEPNALVSVRRDAGRSTPNLRATQVEIYDGLVAESQNRWPTLGFDVHAVNDLLAPLLPAAFYYKTFMWPRSAWHRWYEPAIRERPGSGGRRRCPIRIATPSATHTATCSSSAPVRRVSLPRSLRQPPARASCSATNNPSRAGRCSRNTRR
jgi:sarcosine oxidase subunit alpha